jgi:hypothetical protein
MKRLAPGCDLLQFASQLWRRSLSLLRRGKYEREVEEEMRFHLEMQIEQKCCGLNDEYSQFLKTCRILIVI